MAPTPVSRHTRRAVRTRIFIPQNIFEIKKSVLITDADGNVTDVSDRVMTLNIIGLSLSEGVSSSQVTLSNADGFFIGDDPTDFVFVGGEFLTINADYDDGTTRQYKGKINAPDVALRADNILIIKARTTPEAADRRIRINIDGNAVTAVEDIIDEFLPNVMSHIAFSASLSAITTTIKVSYNATIISILKDIFLRAGWEGNIEFDEDDDGLFDLDGWIAGTQKITDANIFFQENMRNLSNFGTDNDEESNSILLKGKNVGGSPLLTTISDTTHQTQFWRKDFEISDTTIVTQEELDERAILESSKKVDPTRNGIVRSFGDPNMVAGKTIFVQSPNDLVTGDFTVKRYAHQIGNGWLMDVDLDKKQTRTADINKERIKVDDELAPFDNPNDMEHSYNFDFEASTDTANLIETNTNISYVAGKIQLTGGSLGNVVSITKPLPNNLNVFDLILKGAEQFGSSTIEVSNDAGATFDLILNNQQNIQQSFTATGKNLKVRVTLQTDGQNPNPSLDGFSIRTK